MKCTRWLLTAAYAGAIFYLSSRPWSGVALFPFADKLIHFAIYAGLGFLIAWSLRSAATPEPRRLILLAASLTALYGASDEIHQLFVPGRNCDVVDALVDALGGTAGAAAAALLFRGCCRKGGARAHQPA